MGDGLGGGLGTLAGGLPHPVPKAIHGHGKIVEFHATVGIKAFLVIQDNAQTLHEESHYPQPNAGMILEQDIGEPEYRGQHV